MKSLGICEAKQLFADFGEGLIGDADLTLGWLMGGEGWFPGAGVVSEGFACRL